MAATLLLAAGCGNQPVLPLRASSSPSASASPTAAPLPDAPWPAFLRGAARFGVGPTNPALDSVERKWSATVDGLLYAAPLLAAGRVFAATENDTVYAFDAATGGLAWQRHLADPMRGSQLSCGNIDPTGITGTPVIDPPARRSTSSRLRSPAATCSSPLT